MKIKKLLTTPRLIAIALIAIAILTYYLGKEGAITLGIVGIILIIAPTKHAQEMFDKYFETMKNWKTFVITALYEALHWLFIFGAVYFLQWRVMTKMAIAQAQSSLTQEGMQNPVLASQTANALEGFVYFIFISAALALLFGFIVYVISRALIWTTITQQKINKKFLIKFTGLNACWWLVWLPLFALLMIGMSKQPYSKEAITVMLFIAAYFSPITHTLYMKTHKIGYSIGNGIAWGIARVHRFIVPYSYAFVTYVILYQLYRLAQTTSWIKPVSIVFVILFIAWLRIYIYEIVKEFK